MRSHGDPGQATPTIDANKVIHVTISASVPGGWQGYSGQFGYGGPRLHCLTYMDAAEHALGAGPGSSTLPGQAALSEYSECMQANGVPDYSAPLPSGLGLLAGAGGNGGSNNPAYLNASQLCSEKTHVYVPGGIAPPGAVEVNDLGVGGPRLSPPASTGASRSEMLPAAGHPDNTITR